MMIRAARAHAVAFFIGLWSCLAPLSASALEFDAMDASEKAAFGEAVRAYLMANPEVIMEAVEVLRTREAEAQADADRALVATLRDDLTQMEDVYVGGNPEGDVIFVEFLDYNCGYCRRFHPVTMAMLEENDDIRHIILEFPIQGEASVNAARFALSLRKLHGNAMYKAFHDSLMALDVATGDAALRQVADALGLDATEIEAGMMADDITNELTRNVTFADALQISGTPSWILGDYLGRGYVPLSDMRNRLDAVREAM